MNTEKKWAFIVMINSLGIDYGRFVLGMNNILNAYQNASSFELPKEINLEDYAGRYYDFWGGESIIVP